MLNEDDNGNDDVDDDNDDDRGDDDVTDDDCNDMKCQLVIVCTAPSYHNLSSLAVFLITCSKLSERRQRFYSLQHFAMNDSDETVCEIEEDADDSASELQMSPSVIAPVSR